jgi:hypothetical protein
MPQWLLEVMLLLTVWPPRAVGTSPVVARLVQVIVSRSTTHTGSGGSFSCFFSCMCVKRTHKAQKHMWCLQHGATVLLC